ncbi:MAG: ABC transporter ATP-binding protein [Candidatus Leucobacter sulfamidivorax]|nr:ABC transporter ATP-binding protein [Candidatus Leucobacter sulfamidivorax]
MLRAADLELEGRLSPVSLAIEARTRLLLTGPNGAGKSTLLEVLADRLRPDAGELEVRPGARIGHLPQEVEFERPDRSAAETYAALVGADLAERRPLESSGLLAPRDASQPVGALSVGQRRRLALAALLADPPHLLLLDEPTNHLSLTLVEELEAALNAFDGAVVLASHDRHLRALWAGETLALVPA